MSGIDFDNMWKYPKNKKATALTEHNSGMRWPKGSMLFKVSIFICFTLVSQEHDSLDEKDTTWAPVKT